MTLSISIETFFKMLPNLIASGVLFEANEKDNKIEIIFSGGY